MSPPDRRQDFIQRRPVVALGVEHQATARKVEQRESQTGFDATRIVKDNICIARRRHVDMATDHQFLRSAPVRVRDFEFDPGLLVEAHLNSDMDRVHVLECRQADTNRVKGIGGQCRQRHDKRDQTEFLHFSSSSKITTSVFHHLFFERSDQRVMCAVSRLIRVSVTADINPMTTTPRRMTSVLNILRASRMR